MVPEEDKTLMQGLLDEITRVTSIKAEYDKIPAGRFASAFIEADLLEAKRVATAIDVVGIMRMYEKLKAHKL